GAGPRVAVGAEPNCPPRTPGGATASDTSPCAPRPNSAICRSVWGRYWSIISWNLARDVLELKYSVIAVDVCDTISLITRLRNVVGSRSRPRYGVAVIVIWAP